MSTSWNAALNHYRIHKLNDSVNQFCKAYQGSEDRINLLLFDVDAFPNKIGSKESQYFVQSIVICYRNERNNVFCLP